MTRRTALFTRGSLALALTLLAPALAAAAVSSMGEARVRTDVNGVSTFRNDPPNSPIYQTTGGNFRLGAQSSGVSLRPGGGSAFAQSLVTAVNGHPRLLLITENSATEPFTGTGAYAEGGAGVYFSGTVLGDAGADGWLRLSGLMLATVAPGPIVAGINSGAQASMHVAMQLSRPEGCPVAECLAWATTPNQPFSNGAYPVYGSHHQTLGLDYDLLLPVRVGDSFTLTFLVAANASNGYAVAIGNALDLTDDQSFAASAADAYADDDTQALPFGDLFGRLTLSPGLSLSADSGLMRRADGSWAPAVSPVPEPPAALLMALGLLLLLSPRLRLPDEGRMRA